MVVLVMAPRLVQFVLRQSCLAKLAYVSLVLEDPVTALSSSMQLLSLPVTREPWRFLAHNYAAEALVLLNRPAEAAACLGPDVLASGAKPPPARPPALLHARLAAFARHCPSRLWCDLFTPFLLFFFPFRSFFLFCADAFFRCVVVVPLPPTHIQ